MLTKLTFQNWRSLQNVEIDNLKPITVLIGENSSGKTNILDALYFFRDFFEEGDLTKAVYSRGEGKQIQTMGTSFDKPVSIGFTYQVADSLPISYTTHMLFTDNRFKFQAKSTCLEGDKILIDEEYVDLPPTKDIEFLSASWLGDEEAQEHARVEKLFSSLRNFVKSRWQLLDENFMPYLNQSSSNAGDIYQIDRCGDNLVFILDFMKKTQPELYEELQEDFRFLLGHVNHFEADRGEHEARIYVKETAFPEREAPTISAGTARILAVLGAIYALDLKTPDMSGLIVIEEPETSLNPSLLKRFVELLRGYTLDKSRQFILTTHNPTFLNYFKPEEVRVVSRDENGYTSVNPIPDYIRDIWLDEHSLGEVWLTNAFGGVVE